MIAVVELGGKQYNIALGTVFKTEKIDLAEGKSFDVEKVLLVSDADGKNTKIGMPLLKEEKIVAQVISHDKADKIRVFKMKAKKRYSKVQGHRQNYTEVQIIEIGGEKLDKAKIATAKVKTTPVVAKVAPKKKTVAKKVTKAKKLDTIVPVTEKKVVKKTTTAKKTTVAKKAPSKAKIKKAE